MNMQKLFSSVLATLFVFILCVSASAADISASYAPYIPAGTSGAADMRSYGLNVTLTAADSDTAYKVDAAVFRNAGDTNPIDEHTYFKSAEVYFDSSSGMSVDEHGAPISLLLTLPPNTSDTPQAYYIKVRVDDGPWVIAQNGSNGDWSVSVTPEPEPGDPPTVTPAGPINLDINGTKTANINVSLGEITAATPTQIRAAQATATVSGDAVTISPDKLTADGNFIVTAVKQGTATINIAFTGGDVTDDTYNKSITVNVSDGAFTPAPTHTITASAGVGGSISPSGSVSVEDGADQIFNITPNSNYRISSVTVDGASVGAVPSYTFVNVTVNHSISATFTYAGGSTSSGNSSGSGSSSGTNYTAPSIPGSKTFSAADLKAALNTMKQSGKPYALFRFSGKIKIPASILKELGKTPLRVQTTGSPVQVQLTIPEPGLITTDLMASGAVKGTTVNSRKAFFGKWFKNKVQVVHMDHSGSYGQTVEIAAKIDLTGMDTANLYFYSYDKTANTYKRIEKSAYWLDKNGYLHFATELGGDIIISEGGLQKK